MSDSDDTRDNVPDDEQFDLFVSCIVARVAREEPLAEIYALAEQLGPSCLLSMVPANADPAEQRIVFRTLARAIVDQTPRPALRYASRKQPRPGRNDRCDCGSGRKYKQCCHPLESGMPSEPMNLLPYVLDGLPRKRWAELAGSAIDPQMVAATAFGWLAEGDSAAVAALLEPWFKGDAPIPAAHESMLDALLDAYTELDNPRKKKRLLQQALDRGDRVVRSSALQRLATLVADEGDFDQAWRYFQLAQREHADSASLAHLEVILLISQRDVAQARERARFWVARLTRLDPHEHHDLIGFLREVAEQGEQPLIDIQRREWPELATLGDLLAQAPPPTNMHRFEGGDDDSWGLIAPLPTLHKALTQWQQCFPQVGPSLTAMNVPDHPAWEDPQLWLDGLRAQPILWQSLDVLDDLVLALTDVPVQGVYESLAEPLLARAETLWDRLLEAEDWQGQPIEWAVQQNRPALRLLAQRIVPDLARPGDPTVTRMERFLTINPNDNHGFRNDLMAAYLQRGQFEQADQLASRFEHDCELAFGRVLALWALGRQGDALQHLQQAHARLPRLLPMLLAANPRKPRLLDGVVQWGGADQAWLFREQQRPAWDAVPGALDWLRQAGRALKQP